MGNRGEQLAKTFLEGKHLKILQTNLKLKTGEVDLLAQDGKTLVLVEVKTKHSVALGTPLEMVNWKKQRKLVRLAREVSLYYPKRRLRIDVVGILMDEDDEPTDIKYIKNAVEG